MTVTIRELSAMDAMDADDLAYEVARMQERDPSRPRIIKTYALCSVTKIDGEVVPPVRTLEDFKTVTTRLGVRGVDLLAGAFVDFSGEVARAADPKDSPSETSSAS